MRNFFRKISTASLDFVLPPHCAVCGTETLQSGLACAACFQALKPIGKPCCLRCGVAFPAHDYGGERSVCAPCETAPPPWQSGRAAFIYDEASRRLILPLKYADRTENARILGRAMMRAGAELLETATIIAPVPLHRARLWQRRYNQAALLAKFVGRGHAARVVNDLLIRSRRTPPLAHLNASARAQALDGAVALRPKHIAQVKGAHVLLVDDVLTTGATLGACARSLHDAGAAQVDILVAARTVAPDAQSWEEPWHWAA